MPNFRVMAPNAQVGDSGIWTDPLTQMRYLLTLSGRNQDGSWTAQGTQVAGEGASSPANTASPTAPGTGTDPFGLSLSQGQGTPQPSTLLPADTALQPVTTLSTTSPEIGGSTVSAEIANALSGLGGFSIDPGILAQIANMGLQLNAAELEAKIEQALKELARDIGNDVLNHYLSSAKFFGSAPNPKTFDFGNVAEFLQGRSDNPYKGRFYQSTPSGQPASVLNPAPQAVSEDSALLAIWNNRPDIQQLLPQWQGEGKSSQDYVRAWLDMTSDAIVMQNNRDPIQTALALGYIAQPAESLRYDLAGSRGRFRNI